MDKKKFSIVLKSFLLISVLVFTSCFATAQAAPKPDPKVQDAASLIIGPPPGKSSSEMYEEAKAKDPHIIEKIARQYPALYEKMIAQDIKILNENPLAFRQYAAASPRMVDFTLGGNIASYDPKTGIFTTAGAGSTKFSLNELPAMTSESFIVLGDGSLKVIFPGPKPTVPGTQMIISNADIAGSALSSIGNKPAKIQFSGETLSFSGNNAASFSSAGLTFVTGTTVNVITGNNVKPDLSFTVTSPQWATYTSAPCANPAENCLSVNPSEPDSDEKTLSASGSGIDITRQVDAKGNPTGDIRSMDIHPKSELFDPTKVSADKYPHEIIVSDKIGDKTQTVLYFNGLGMNFDMDNSKTPPKGWESINVFARKDIFVPRENAFVPTELKKTYEEKKSYFIAPADFEYTYGFSGSSVSASICQDPISRTATTAGYVSHYCTDVGRSIASATDFQKYMVLTGVVRDWTQTVNYAINNADATSSTGKKYAFITPELLLAQIAHESEGDPYAVGGKGVGLFQFDSSSATPFAYGLCGDRNCQTSDYRTDPAKEATAAVRYLSDLYEHYKKVPSIADEQSRIYFTVAAYNTGQSNVDALIAAAPHTRGKVSWTDVWSSGNDYAVIRAHGYKPNNEKVVIRYAPNIIFNEGIINKKTTGALGPMSPEDCQLLAPDLRDICLKYSEIA